jgi:hypothetical protein
VSEDQGGAGGAAGAGAGAARAGGAAGAMAEAEDDEEEDEEEEDDDEEEEDDDEEEVVVVVDSSEESEEKRGLQVGKCPKNKSRQFLRDFLKINACYFNEEHDRCYCAECAARARIPDVLDARTDHPYEVPKGWCGFALKLPSC